MITTGYCLIALNKPSLPQGFVYLSSIDPSIQQAVRYAGGHHFLARPVKGYHSEASVVVTQKTAEALKRVQERVKKDGYELVVYDGYRPQHAVDDFRSAFLNNIQAKAHYFPREAAEDLFKKGYVARRSGHSRGSAVDLTIIKKGKKVYAPQPKKRILSDGFKLFYLDDGTVDMGTSFDLFDVASWGKSTLVPVEAQKMRAYLAHVMNEAGFKGFRKEWWHFTLVDEPFRAIYFDFAF